MDAPRDTCPNAGGPDVFRNILDYPPDDCMDRLTTGQATRMAVGWNAYRWVHTHEPEVLTIPGAGTRPAGGVLCIVPSLACWEVPSAFKC